MNIGTPGSYSSQLNKIFKLHNFPEIKIPKEPDSKKIIGEFTNAENKSIPTNEETVDTIVTENEQQRDKLNITEVENRPARQTKEKQSKVIKGTDIGLKSIHPKLLDGLKLN